MENTNIKYFEIEELGIWPIYTPDVTVSEGEQKLTEHLERERNSKIVKLAKELFKIKHNGRLFCELCNFDFEKEYGDLGKGFIEAHHIKPISKMLPEDSTKIEDFKMVCSNCHSMLHIGTNWISPEELERVLHKHTY